MCVWWGLSGGEGAVFPYLTPWRVALAWVWNTSLCSQGLTPPSSELVIRAGEVRPVMGVPCIVNVADSLTSNDCGANTFCSLWDTFIVSSASLAVSLHSPVFLCTSGLTRDESHGDRS